MISIITPHHNDFEGLKCIYNCMKKQSSDAWEWLIIDDLSHEATRDLVTDFFKTLPNSQVRFLLNPTKTNASVCRNIGINHAANQNLVFLDSDDSISRDFVANRLIEVNDFVIFKNTNVLNEKGKNIPASGSKVKSDYLNYFLKANFVWPITSVLWNKDFLIQIGKFDENLLRLQDIELSIRALLVGENYKVIDNKVDFFYHSKPIRLKPDIVSKSCASVNYLILKIHKNYTLSAYQESLIKGYYYACIKSLIRTGIRKDVGYVKESLKLFYKKKYINAFRCFIGMTLLFLYRYHMISDSLFIKVNRYFFK